MRKFVILAAIALTGCAKEPEFSWGPVNMNTGYTSAAAFYRDHSVVPSAAPTVVVQQSEPTCVVPPVWPAPSQPHYIYDSAGVLQATVY